MMRWVHPLKGMTIKERLALALSEALGADENAVDPEDITQANPVHIANALDDTVLNWEWQPTARQRRVDGLPGLMSWDRMKDCCRYGFSFDRGYGSYRIMVVANLPPPTGEGKP